MNRIDCRNMPCPAPVISVKKALENFGEICAFVDDGAPRENVTRFAVNRGFMVSEERIGGGWGLTITKGTIENIKTESSPLSGGILFLFTSDRLGDGPEELGRLLMRNLIHSLLETAELPSRMIFMNRGVFLTSEGSEVLEALNKLAGMGVEILSCGLCLDFFGIKDKLLTGSTTNMLTTVETLLSDYRVIRL